MACPQERIASWCATGTGNGKITHYVGNVEIIRDQQTNSWEQQVARDTVACDTPARQAMSNEFGLPFSATAIPLPTAIVSRIDTAGSWVAGKPMQSMGWRLQKP